MYVHISPSNKYYVGITKLKPHERWGKNGYGYRNQTFYRAIQKYGWKNFQHEIIAEHLTEDEAKKLEIILIDKLQSHISKNGYNVTLGGDGFLGIRKSGENNSFYGKHHTEETKKKLSEIAKERHKNNPNLYKGRRLTEERKKQIGIEHSKKILQFDQKMNFIAEHPNSLSLEKQGFRRASIREVCNGKRETYKGFIWKYEDQKEECT